jgi:hypothetical protein
MKIALTKFIAATFGESFIVVYFRILVFPSAVYIRER